MSQDDELKTVVDHILDYAKKRPDWQSEVIRRAAQHGELTSDDLEDAVRMCKHAHGLHVANPPKPVPLQANHLPKTGSNQGDVVLVALRDLEGVNALLPGQALKFGQTGLTSVFGHNGSGKTGYARVLKRLCRARGSAEPILGDVFDKSPPDPKATVEFREGAQSRDWTGELTDDSPASPEALGHVSVYDRRAGTVVLEKGQPIELMPAGLDILQELVRALDHVRNTLKAEAQQDQQAPHYPELEESTKAGKFLANLDATIPATEIAQACAWENSDDQELEDARQEKAALQAEDPKKRAKKMRTSAQRYEELAQKLKHLDAAIDDDAQETLQRRTDELSAAKEALRVAREAAFSDEQLLGTGTSPWRRMWTAAREFSLEAAYPDQDFPFTGESARCVLCQQDLDSAASARLEGFEDFVTNKIAQQVRTAQDAVDSNVHALAETPARGLLQHSLREELEANHPDLLEAVEEYLERAASRRTALLEAIGDQEAWADLPAVAESPVADINTVLAQMRATADELAGQSVEQAVQELTKVIREMQARKELASHKKTLLDEVKRLKRLQKRNTAQRAARTGSVSRKLSDLTNEFVTEAFRDAFNKELKALQANRLRVEIVKKKATKGVTYTELRLVDAEQHAAPATVLSDGEQRIVALAAFFAELALSDSRSAIVFDDPVTSLDHVRRRHIAERLVQEAEERQVVVFTHDTVFQVMLRKACERLNQPRTPVVIRKHAGKPGFMDGDEPWDSLSTGKRMKRLKRRYQDLKSAFTKDRPNYDSLVTTFYGLLRETWERAIEEVYFAGTIQRMDYEVHTRRISKIDIENSDYDTIETGMGKCSRWLDGHDQATAVNEPPPQPGEVAEDFNLLAEWLRQLRDRRKRQGQMPKPKSIPVSSKQSSSDSA